MRVLAAGTERCIAWASPVTLLASATLTSRRRSVRPKCIAELPARLGVQPVPIARSSVVLGACQPTIAPCAAIIASVAALNSGK